MQPVYPEVAGHEVLWGMGERESVDTTATGEDLTRINELSSTPSAPASTILVPTPSSAGEQMTVVCENVADTPAGAGAATVGIQYLDPNGDPQETTVILNGTGAVDLTPPDVRFVQSMFVKSLGATNTTGVATGHIRIYKKATTNLVYNMIAAGGNMSLVPHRMVPRGKNLYLQHWSACEKTTGKRSDVRLRVDCSPDPVGVLQSGVFLFKATLSLNQTAISEPLCVVCPPLSTVKVSGWAKAINAELSARWQGVLADA